MEDAEKVIINRLKNVLKGQGMYIIEDTTTPIDQRVTQMNIVSQLSHFLDSIEKECIERDKEKESRGDDR